jgi:hypothetical protein
VEVEGCEERRMLVVVSMEEIVGIFFLSWLCT